MGEFGSHIAQFRGLGRPSVNSGCVHFLFTL
jgi:hypothetical protein